MKKWPHIFMLSISLAILFLVHSCENAAAEDESISSPEEEEEEEVPQIENAVLRINSGGSEISFDETTFSADTYFGSEDYTFTNTEVTEISGTEMDALYFSERSAEKDLAGFSYNIPITNGSYDIRLHFAEIFFGQPNGSSGEVGARIFSVSIEGNEVLTDYDIFKEVGSGAAVIKSFDITVEDEELNIDFSASANRPKLSALEIIGDGQILVVDSGWKNLQSSNLAKLESQSAKIGNKLYVFAGFTENLKITDATEIYDTTTDTWSFGSPMPTAVTHMGAAVVGDDVWIVGGFEGDHPGVAIDKVQIYDTTTDSWTDGPSLPAPRASGAAVYNDGKIHFFGGLLPDRVTDTDEHYILDLNNIPAGWNLAAPMPNGRNHLSGASIDGRVYAIGGQFGHDNGVDDQNFLDRYDPGTDTWKRMRDLPRDRSHFEPGTAVHENKIIIVGGRDQNYFFNNVIAYDPLADSWSELFLLPEKNLAPAAKIFDNKLIVANGGEGGICCPLDEVKFKELKDF